MNNFKMQKSIQSCGAKRVKRNFKFGFTGFTLIELLVSVSIITIITGLFLANYHSASNRQKLIVAAQKMASDIRMAQQFSLGAKKHNGSVPAEGWGAHISGAQNGNYIIFADNNNDSVYEYTAGLGEEFQTINLPDGVVVSSILVNSAPVSSVDIVFLQPDPTTFINNDSTVAVQIQLSNGDTVKTIEVNSLGLVDVLD